MNVSHMKLLGSNQVIVKEADKEVLRLIKIYYNGVEKFTDTVVYQEYGLKIEKISCSNNKIYVLCRKGAYYAFKSFHLGDNL